MDNNNIYDRQTHKHGESAESVKIMMIILQNYILSVFELELGNTVKYVPLPFIVPFGFAFGKSLRRRTIFDHISLFLSKYGYIISDQK